MYVVLRRCVVVSSTMFGALQVKKQSAKDQESDPRERKVTLDIKCCIQQQWQMAVRGLPSLIFVIFAKANRTEHHAQNFTPRCTQTIS